MDNMELIAEMCEISLMKQIDKDIESWTEPVEFSYSFYKKMSRALGVNVMPRKYIVRRTIALIAAAAILLLTACAAYIYRDDIKGLFVEKFEDRDKVSVDEKLSGKVYVENKDMYYLSYVPNGFTLIEEYTNNIRVSYIFCNEKRDTMSFSQTTYNTMTIIDNEHAIMKCIDHVEYEIYYLHADRKHYYAWYDGEYYNTISTCAYFNDDEMRKIINGIIKK